AGVIAPLQNVTLTSSLSEPADQVLVREGDRVTAGQTLAVLATADLRATLDADSRAAASADAKATQARYQADLAIGQGGDQVSSAHAALAQAQQNLAQAQSDLKRDQSLIASGYISQQAFSLQQTLVNNDQSAVRSAQAALTSANTNARVNGTGSKGLQAANIAAAAADAAAAHAQVEQIQAQISKSIIVSPIAGIVVNRNLNPGEYPGSRTIFTIQADHSVYAMLNASSADVFKLARGSPVRIAASGSNAAFSGNVVAVLGQVSPGSTNFTVEVLVPNVDGKLASGIPVTGTVQLPATTGLGIPVSAFLDDTHKSVMTIAGGQAHVAPVTEITDDGRTAIVRGLGAGTRVVVNGQLGLADGEPVTTQ
ncbi:MAG: efflux RND transporter periplasmic adaptor subunit, partial [Vulcanimicrobiaceae bacterium]